MADIENARYRSASEAPESVERRQLSLLAEALTKYGVTSSLVGPEPPVLRVRNPGSDYAVEDIGCERREHGHAFLASFGVHLGTSESIPMTAKKVAWLVGATDP
ncbi:hypothetical protein [Nocardiopsis composta]|uniref:Uncharacterized protein n=1 Tax=Nocardiopsis composta TaxID=157465 RepID=A0A7W8QLS6_9ACTN|nr:hypothetical protein [Nocardiopsis composta]MBB5432808.1 hypothetical protein [Nocardiopsis composta]